MSKPAESDIEIVEPVLLSEPELTPEQERAIFCVVQADFGDLGSTDATGKEVIQFASMLVAKQAPIRVINSIYRFVTSSQPGEYLWTGHLTPMFFHTSKDRQAPMHPKNLKAPQPKNGP